MLNIFFAYGNQQKKMKVMLKAQQEELEDNMKIAVIFVCVNIHKMCAFSRWMVICWHLFF